MSIDLIIIDEHNRPIEHRVIKQARPHGCAVQLTPDTPVGDRIFLRPDWPPIGSQDFAARLRAWHAANNGALITDD